MRMYLVSTLLVALFSTVFESSIDRAFTAAKMNDWPGAAAALDEAFTQDPQTFDANNLHYLRGRIAENQNEWLRAREEFNKIPADNPLYSLAVWHALRASVQIHDEASAAQLLMKSTSRRSSLLIANFSRRCCSTKKPRPIRRTPPMQDMKQAAFTFSFRTTGRQSTCIAPS